MPQARGLLPPPGQQPCIQVLQRPRPLRPERLPARGAEERAHQGVGHVRLPGVPTTAQLGTVHCSEGLGGLLKSYSRAA